MIRDGVKLTIRKIPLSDIHVCQYERRYPKRVKHYRKLMRKHPDMYAGLGYVVPSDRHKKAFALLDGYHRYVSSIMEGKRDMLCVVEEENE